MVAASITVEPVRQELWPELSTVFGDKGDAAGCWCQWFKLSGKQFREHSTEERRELLNAQVASTPAPGVIAWLDGEPVGWSAVEPYSAYPGLARSPITKRVEGDPADPWAITCFVVRNDYRRRGVARALVRGALDHALDQGATTVEGYPVDPGVRPSLSAAERYHGTVALFDSAGFREIRRPSATRVIMRFEASRLRPRAETLGLRP